jgi:hypothetical protein
VVADRELLYAGSDLHDDAGTLVAEHYRPWHWDSPVSDGQVAVTDTAGSEFYQHLALAWRFDLDPLDRRSVAGVAADDGFGLHLSCSMPSPHAAFNICEIRFHCAKQKGGSRETEIAEESQSWTFASYRPGRERVNITTVGR